MKLEELLAEAPEPPTELEPRLRWIEAAADALDELATPDRNAERDAALLLRAALGAIVRWSQGPRDAGSLRELEAVLRALLAKGLGGLYAAAAERHRELARDRATPHRAACGELARAFDEAAEAARAGQPIPEAVRRRVQAAARSIDR